MKKALTYFSLDQKFRSILMLNNGINRIFLVVPGLEDTVAKAPGFGIGVGYAKAGHVPSLDRSHGHCGAAPGILNLTTILKSNIKYPAS